MKIDFIIGGTQKGGTTALDAYLRKHPEICMADKKELHFFLCENTFQHNSIDYAQYHRWFHPQEGQRVLGEATPAYMYWYDAPRRIWEYNPDMKWVLLLRNPIERAYSHWNMARECGWDEADFLTALQNERIRCREVLPLQHKRLSYQDRGFYTEQVRRIWFFFPRSQTLILKSEALRTDPAATLHKVCHFLGVESFSQVEPLTLRAGTYAAPLGGPERRYLHTVFEYEIKALEQLLDWDCSDWLL